jgi:hypothetical protein
MKSMSERQIFITTHSKISCTCFVGPSCPDISRSNWPLPAAEGSKTPRKTQAVVFGIGSLFNHSLRQQNVGWMRDVSKGVVIYRTLQDVKKGDELCISYGDRLTFVDADAKQVDSDDEDENAALSRIDLV